MKRESGRSVDYAWVMKICVDYLDRIDVLNSGQASGELQPLRDEIMILNKMRIPEV